MTPSGRAERHDRDRRSRERSPGFARARPASRGAAGPAVTTQHIGAAGELLVKYRLLKLGIDSAPDHRCRRGPCRLLASKRPRDHRAGEDCPRPDRFAIGWSTSYHVRLAQQLVDKRDAGGSREYTITQIAQMLGVSRSTLYRALKPMEPAVSLRTRGTPE